MCSLHFSYTPNVFLNHFNFSDAERDNNDTSRPVWQLNRRRILAQAVPGARNTGGRECDRNDAGPGRPERRFLLRGRRPQVRSARSSAGPRTKGDIVDPDNLSDWPHIQPRKHIYQQGADWRRKYLGERLQADTGVLRVATGHAGPRGRGKR